MSGVVNGVGLAGSDITFDFRMAELDLFGIYGGTVGKRVRNAESQPSAAIFERLRIEVVELIQLLRLCKFIQSTFLARPC
jgi:hypothetical protein